MSDTEPTVYLQDVAVPSSVKVADAPATDKPAEVAAGTSKRQRTLLDMFGVQENTPSAKKKKVTQSSTASAGSSNMVTSTVPSQAAEAPDSVPFDVMAFKESLSDEHKKLLQLECEVMGRSWLKLLQDEIRKPYFLSLKGFLWEQGVKGPDDIPKPLAVYPSPQNIYAWSNTALGRVKVVIIGQDPYHGPGQAHGLCFSVPPGVAIPPSLRNIYAEIKAEYPEFEPPKHGNLTGWTDDGVLLLNTCLTVKANQAGSHSNKGWETFTSKVVEVIDTYGGADLGANKIGVGRGVVFLAWGAWAAKRVAKLNRVKHLVLTSAHPSPLSAHKGFLGNGHFKKANDWLERKYGPANKVNWCNL